MKRDFTHGTPEQMIAAFEGQIAKLEGDISSASDIDVELEVDDEEADAITAAYRNDDILGAVDDPYVTVESDPTNVDEFIRALISDVNAELENDDQFDNWTWEADPEEAKIVLIVIDGSDAHEYSIPFNDLTMSWDSIDTDVNYILSAVLPGSNNASNEAIEESTNIEIVQGGLFDFGEEAAAKYGDLICENLAGKTVSKRRDLAEQPGGLIYEAKELGIDMWDLLEALEGLCRQRRCTEIDDSTYKVLGSSSIQSATVADNGKMVFQLMDYSSDPASGIEGDDFYCYGEFFANSMEDALNQLEIAKKEYVEFFESGSVYVDHYNEYFATGREICSSLIALLNQMNVEDMQETFETVGPDDDDLPFASTQVSDDGVLDEEVPIEANTDEERWIELESKQVPDADGFSTEYTLYRNEDSTMFICMFGDKDVYSPDPSYADFETENEQEAYDWFYSYNGFEDEDVYNSEEVVVEE